MEERAESFPPLSDIRGLNYKGCVYQISVMEVDESAAYDEYVASSRRLLLSWFSMQQVERRSLTEIFQLSPSSSQTIFESNFSSPNEESIGRDVPLQESPSVTEAHRRFNYLAPI